MKMRDQIAEILKDYCLTQDTAQFTERPLLKRIQHQMENGEKLVFILPAFPAKSPSPLKTSGTLPDFGEVLALQNLQSLCDRISDLYPPGAELVICSDGRVFSDVVLVDDLIIDEYNDGIRSIILEYNLTSLKVFTMDDLYPTLGPTRLRQLLLDVYAVSLNEVKKQVSTDDKYRALFNGIHRFLCEDEHSLFPNLSRSAIQKRTKERTYELLRRSDAWSSLLSAHFSKALRLSIHPHAANNEKFGVKLVPSSNKWATPWHNVVVKKENRFELMHKKQALDLNAILRLERDKYAYFEIASV